MGAIRGRARAAAESGHVFDTEAQFRSNCDVVPAADGGNSGGAGAEAAAGAAHDGHAGLCILAVLGVHGTGPGASSFQDTADMASIESRLEVRIQAGLRRLAVLGVHRAGPGARI